MSLDTDTDSAFNKIRTKKTRYVIYRMKASTIYVDEVSPRNNGWTDLREELTDSKAAFIVYDYEYKARDGRVSDKMYFIFWCPRNTPQTDKILYSQALHNFKSRFSGIVLEELADEDELEELLGNEELDPSRLA